LPPRRRRAAAGGAGAGGRTGGGRAAQARSSSSPTATFALYFNIDNMTRSAASTQSNGRAPIFRAWMAPFRNIGMTDLTIRNTGGTDHQAFHAVGLPGFQFIQDPVQYSSRTHHSNLDVYDQLIPGDLMKNAAITAAFVYHAANRAQMLPRRPLPKPVTGRDQVSAGSHADLHAR
jgi:Zn-dependent M28 family amino/carboxypeptidase